MDDKNVTHINNLHDQLSICTLAAREKTVIVSEQFISTFLCPPTHSDTHSNKCTKHLAVKCPPHYITPSLGHTPAALTKTLKPLKSQDRMAQPWSIGSPAFGGLNLTRRKRWLPKHLCVRVSFQLNCGVRPSEEGWGCSCAEGDQQRVRAFQPLHRLLH